MLSNRLLKVFTLDVSTTMSGNVFQMSHERIFISIDTRITFKQFILNNNNNNNNVATLSRRTVSTFTNYA